jgi:hypothetical protein
MAERLVHDMIEHAGAYSMVLAGLNARVRLILWNAVSISRGANHWRAVFVDGKQKNDLGPGPELKLILRSLIWNHRLVSQSAGVRP